MAVRRGKYMRITEEQEIAWAAGLFDGEGCVTTLWPKRFQARLEINMVHKPTLNHFAFIILEPSRNKLFLSMYSKAKGCINCFTQVFYKVFHVLLEGFALACR